VRGVKDLGKGVEKRESGKEREEREREEDA